MNTKAINSIKVIWLRNLAPPVKQPKPILPINKCRISLQNSFYNKL